MTSHSPHLHLIECLQSDGLATASNILNSLLHDIAWQSPSEFMKAFGFEMEKIKQNYWSRMSEETQSAFSSSAQSILKRFPQLEL